MDIVDDLRFTADDEDIELNASVADLLKKAAAEVARLRLADAERVAIQRLVEDYEQDSEPASAGVVATLQRLLERTK